MNKIEKEIKTYLEERGWDNLLPSDIAKSISIESAELLEHFQWDNKPLDEVKSETKKKIAIGEEIADVMIYCIELAVLLGMSTDDLIRDKLEKIKKKYPAQLFKNRKKGDDLYWNIKRQHRRRKTEL